MFEKLNPEPPADGSSVRLADKYRFLGCRVHATPEENRPEYIFLPVTVEVYGKFMMDPSMAGHYLEKVEEYEQHSDSADHTKPEIVEPTTIHVQETISKSTFPPVELLPVKEPAHPPGPRQLARVDSADCLVHVHNGTLSRTDSDPQRIAPAFSVFGVSKEFGLDVEFDVQLSAVSSSAPTKKLNVLSKADLWIRNPQHGFTYGIARSSK